MESRIRQGRAIIAKLGFTKNSQIFYDQLVKLYNTRGWKSTLSYIKAVRLSVKRYSGGSPVSRNEVDNIRLTKDGIPVILGNLIYQLRSRDLKIIQEILSIQQFDHLSDWWPEPDQSPIKDYSSVDENRGSYKNLVRKSLSALLALGIEIPREVVGGKGYHMTSKQGIFTHSLWSSLKELTTNGFWPLIGYHLSRLPGKEDMVKLHTQVDRKERSLTDLFPDAVKGKIKNREFLRRLAIVRSPAGKTRVVAIFDYWTQVAFRPTHLYVIKHLGKWFEGNDMTKNQDGFDPSIPKGPIYSFDQTAATDRLPMIFQREIMERLIGQSYSNIWHLQKVCLPFNYEGKRVYYNAGQPKGAYTSWAVFALCHHQIVRVAGHNVHKHYNFSSYYLLGDDIVIWGDKRVAQEYHRLVTVVLGCKISQPKTQVSGNSFEFAKRFFIKGVEVSHLPWPQLVLVKGAKSTQPGFLTDVVRRSVNPSPQTKALCQRWTRFFRFPIQESKAQYLSVAWNLGQRNIDTYPSGKTLEWLKLTLPCSSKGSVLPLLTDIRSWGAIRLLKKVIPKVSEEWTSKTAEFANLIFKSQIESRQVPPTSLLKENVKKLSDISYDIDVAFQYEDTESDLDMIQIYSDIDSFNLLDVSFRNKNESLSRLQGKAFSQTGRYLREYRKALL